MRRKLVEFILSSAWLAFKLCIPAFVLLGVLRLFADLIEVDIWSTF